MLQQQLDNLERSVLTGLWKIFDVRRMCTACDQTIESG
jgi:hypothetical protein